MTQITHKESQPSNRKGALNAGDTEQHPEVRQAEESVGQPDKTLYDNVVHAMEAYFSHLDGEHSTGIYHMVIAQVESALLTSVMKHAGDNQTLAAKCLGISRGTLMKKLALYHIIPSRKRGAVR